MKTLKGKIETINTNQLKKIVRKLWGSQKNEEKMVCFNALDVIEEREGNDNFYNSLPELT